MCLRKRINRDFLRYFYSINVQFLHRLHLSISQKKKRCRRKLEILTEASFSIAVCVTDHLSGCMYTIPRSSQQLYCLLCLPLCRSRCLSFLLKLSRMTTLLGKSKSFCSSSVLSEKCFVVLYVFSVPPAVFVGTLNLIASIPDPSILALIK